MKSFEVALAAMFATAFVTAQIPDLPQLVSSGLPDTYPASYSQQPSTACLTAITTSLAAASTVCALADVPSYRKGSIPLADLDSHIHKLEVFQAAFCTTACGAALKAYTNAVIISCSRDPTMNHSSVASTCGIVQVNIVFEMIKRGSPGSDPISQLFCNPCGAQFAKACQSIANGTYHDTSINSKYQNAADQIGGYIAQCPGGPPTPATNGVLSATALSVPATSSASSYGVRSRLAFLAALAAIGAML
ncbi:hypothetical protein BDK51DRAFT_31547 [Blyttiomyces helicus]|uniref:Uncharacterized protein n=1 Tax=Blyttiomyces helicus TaxID=388810 RepID=A0A4P9W017_9FUNG|nr:hypothetical protein BDK51DRAFT_31547 [Blyttiomyces helicus]|eukprot:RKO85439.1 hypothetical protein BDK51DRAFT_31547 [Blyttiomyces helicus]